MRIDLIIPSLQTGGSERVLSIMANYWAARGETPRVITLDAPEGDFYELDPRVERVGFDVWRKKARWGMVRQRRRLLREALREGQPDVVISFLLKMNILVLSAARGLGLPVVISERVDPAYPFGLLWRLLRRHYYPAAAALVVQTESVKQALRSLNEKVRIIPNPAEPAAEEATAQSPSGHRTLLAAGRLHPQKGFDLLVKSFATLAAKHPHWTLVILGEGGERGKLESLVRRRGLEERVLLPGNVPAPSSYLAGADLFVLSSRYEGFPNALLEAMALGRAVISFDCPSGPGEIIRHQQDGLLVPPRNMGKLAEAMSQLMSSEAQRERLGKKAREVRERFRTDKIMQRWNDLLRQVCN